MASPDTAEQSNREVLNNFNDKIPLPSAPVAEVDAWLNSLCKIDPFHRHDAIPETFHLSGKQLWESTSIELIGYFEKFVFAMHKDVAAKVAMDITVAKEKKFRMIAELEAQVLERAKEMLGQRIDERKSAGWSQKAITDDLISYQTEIFPSLGIEKLDKNHLENSLKRLASLPHGTGTTLDDSDLSSDSEGSEYGIVQDYSILQRAKTAVNWIIITTKRFRNPLLSLLQAFLLVFLIGRPLYNEYKENGFGILNLSLSLFKDNWLRASVAIVFLPILVALVEIMVLKVIIYCQDKKLHRLEKHVEILEMEKETLIAIHLHRLKDKFAAADTLHATLPKQNEQSKYDPFDRLRRTKIQLIVGVVISLISTVIMEFAIMIHIQENGIAPTPVYVGVFFHVMIFAYLHYARGKAELLEKQVEEQIKRMEQAKADWAAGFERETKEHDARQQRLTVARQRSALILEGRDSADSKLEVEK